MQVAERINDLRRLSTFRRDALQKMASKENRKLPVQVVSPEKLQRKISGDSNSTGDISPSSPNKVSLLALQLEEILHAFVAPAW